MKTVTNVQQTSILAFISVLSDLNVRQAQVYNAIEAHAPICNLDLADVLGIPINQISPRCLELRDKGLVVESHREQHPRTGRLSLYWRAA